MTITLEANPSDAPCCVKIIAQDGRDLLIQTDWDWPSVATTFGWSTKDFQMPGYADKPCEHDRTDGTVPCTCCAATAHDFIQGARQWIDDHDGAQAEDPGYFD